MQIHYNYKLLRDILSKNHSRLQVLSDILQEISTRAFNRLDYIKITPNKILDCGYGSGYDNQLLRNKFAVADVYNLDLVKANLPQVNQTWLNKVFNKKQNNSLVANGLAIPFKSNSIDLVYANQLIPYIDNVEQFIGEVFRVLAVGGTCLLSGLGVDSFKELREYGLSTFRFPDMHDIGDMMIDAGFSNPVVDTEYLNIQYDSLAQALHDIRIVGGGAANAIQLRNFITQKCYQNLYNDLNKPINITLEIFVVHGWKDKIKLNLPAGVSPINIVKK